MTQFDGPNRRIITDVPTASVLNINVQQQMYSESKVWMTGEVDFDTELDVNGATERITYSDHGMYTGQRVIYENLGGSETIGLTDGTEYFVREIDRDTFELYDTKTNAETVVSTVGRIDLTASGGGLGETHRVQNDNAKFPVPFRTVGGDPLTPGVEAGAYFFLQNQVGSDWRIISTDEDQTINYNGNLVGEDGTLPLIVATPGRTVLHLGLQPVTQRVDEILIQSQLAAYNGVVAIDVLSPNSGTAFPTGTRSFPVNNISDAQTIAASIGSSAFEFIGSLTLNDNYPAWRFTGGTSSDNDVLDFNGFNVDNSRFEGCSLQGSYTGSIEATECTLLVITGLSGHFRRSGILLDSALASGGNVIMDACFSEVPGSDQPAFDCDGALSLQLRNWSGGLELINVNNALFTASVDLDPGTIIVPDGQGNTAGTILFRGIGTKTVGASVGTTIIDRLFDVDEFEDVHGQVRRGIYIDTGAASNGDGRQQFPFNNLTDGIDAAEAKGLTQLIFLDDATIDRTIKNFDLLGQGNPVIDTNLQNLSGCSFTDLQINGEFGAFDAGKSVRANRCTLRNNLAGIAGQFFECGFDGDLTLAAVAGSEAIFVDCFSEIGGLGRPTLDLNGNGGSTSVRSYRGGLTVLGSTNAANETTVGVAEGKLTLDATNTLGTISVRGAAQFTDLSTGATVDMDGLIDTTELSIAIASNVGNADTTGDGPYTVEIKDRDLNVIRTISVSADNKVRRIV